MTANPRKVTPETSLAEVARLLLSANFTGLPVVDRENRPVGVIAQGDLIYKAGLPMRIGLLAVSDQEKVGAVLKALEGRQAQEVMTKPPVTIGEDSLVTEAVALMLKKGVKRLPVVDTAGKLAGILSRLDIFHAGLKECPDWRAFQQQQIAVDLRSVADIMNPEVPTVLPETPVEEVIGLIDSTNVQRVCVVDKEGHLQGLISDRDLLAAFSDPSLWDYLVSKFSSGERGRLGGDLRNRRAGEVMNTKIVTVREDAPIDEALRLMLERGIKRLPVVDGAGKLQGMVSREALLRAGFDTPR